MNGVVPESVLVRIRQPVRLGQAEWGRMRYKSAWLGLHDQDVRVHVDADPPDVEMVAHTGEGNVFLGAGVVQALLPLRGHVTSRAVDGVAQLAGLGARQMAALKAWAALVAALAVRGGSFLLFRESFPEAEVEVGLAYCCAAVRIAWGGIPTPRNRADCRPVI
ncbi:hypothetical protein AB0M00_10450 [Streptomyces chartreusis]|uniref:hypothetical protein n=1 Tax=Streptomyces chartreusis TaxID=1969 RepID=UPI00343701A3